MRNPFLKKKIAKESVVEKYLKRRVEEAKGEVRKVKFLDRNGAPDRLVMFPGVLVWVELKSEVGKLRPEQEREHARLFLMGQDVHVIREKHEVDILIPIWAHQSAVYSFDRS